MSDEQTASQICVRCHVAGQVQGVFFRASAREEALRRGITGYARNLPDGRVEIFACGNSEAINELKQWLSHGPPAAEVTGVACEVEEFRAMSGFSTQ